VKVLKAENISVGYGPLQVLWDVSLDVEKGEIVSLLGPNGAGKTTLFNTLAGLLNTRKGRIILNGHDITRLTPDKRVKRGLALVPQGRTVFPLFTVQENLEIGGFTTSNIEDALEYVVSLFPFLKARMGQRAGTLSGGEQKMLEIARALMAKPSMLLLDEPSLGLAPKVVDTLFSAVKRLSIERELSILIAEQNIYKALKISSRAYIMNLGRIVKHFEEVPSMDISNLAKLYFE
jgi:branched-chain amino acid transport system ATP-binding protein